MMYTTLNNSYIVIKHVTPDIFMNIEMVYKDNLSRKEYSKQRLYKHRYIDLVEDIYQ